MNVIHIMPPAEAWFALNVPMLPLSFVIGACVVLIIFGLSRPTRRH